MYSKLKIKTGDNAVKSVCNSNRSNVLRVNNEYIISREVKQFVSNSIIKAWQQCLQSQSSWAYINVFKLIF